MKAKAVHSLAKRWMQKLGVPEGAIGVAVGDKEYRQISGGFGLGHFWGQVTEDRQGFGIGHYRNRTKEEIENTIVHEIAHILWPSVPHWWIECWAQRVAPKEGLQAARRLASLGYGNAYAGRYSRRYAHEVDELPSRAKCIAMAKRRVWKLLRTDPQKS